ncbi:hypothetical protein BDF20DRAFT_874309 [Mycotypha africana]|uniref:uncharacterized protein n=1 Tax=Mycotypha africana TaxID=64632 RepID=UPI0023004ADB|nr:uncharacterized protein BDF20DRAFT_874309 [Mycotypha africana]KAI8977352.1 hypothetical protein BDF20DRAFT_874309 [Mycotypha africana]
MRFLSLRPYFVTVASYKPFILPDEQDEYQRTSAPLVPLGMDSSHRTIQFLKCKNIIPVLQYNDITDIEAPS